MNVFLDLGTVSGKRCDTAAAETRNPNRLPPSCKLKSSWPGLGWTATASRPICGDPSFLKWGVQPHICPRTYAKSVSALPIRSVLSAACPPCSARRRFSRIVIFCQILREKPAVKSSTSSTASSSTGS